MSFSNMIKVNAPSKCMRLTRCLRYQVCQGMAFKSLYNNN